MEQTTRYAPSPLIDSVAGRGLAIYRGLALVWAGALVLVHREHLERPGLVLAYLLVILGWSLLAPLLPRPSGWAIALETTLAVLGVLMTSVVYDPVAVEGGISTVPGVWAAGSVMAGALYAGVRGGVVVASIIALANVVQTPHESVLTIHNIILLYLVGSLVGLCVELARESQVRLEAALAATARLRERERIGREVHDGVLQTLSYINRRGRELGPHTLALAEMAADQERSLRTLITRFEPAGEPDPGRDCSVAQVGGPGTGCGPQRCDLSAHLSLRRAARVEVVLPSGRVELPCAVVREVDAAVAAALDNVTRHAGPQARAWILLDAHDHGVDVVVRDDGPGLAPGRLVEAAAQGRLGASSSIAGRMRDLGGQARWRAPAGGGCTVTLSLPREVADVGAADMTGSRP